MTAIIALYLRVSTDEQAEEGHSLTEQEEKLCEFACSRGWRDVRLYRDEGYSGKNLDRPAMKRLIRDVESGSVSGVLTTRIDRLTRRTRDFAHLIEFFNNHGAFYKSLRQDFEIGTASGKLSAQVFAIFAEFERDMISERVYENLISMARRGKVVTKPAFGYKLVDGQLVPHPEQAKWVRTAAQLLLQGHGARRVAGFLNESGVPTKSGKLWSDGTVRTLFKNKVLTGCMIWNRRKGSGKGRRERDREDWIVQEHHHEALLTPQEFVAINDQIARRSSMSPRARNGSRLFSGIARCGFCGGPMHAGWQIYEVKGGIRRRKTYRCGSYVKYGTCRINRVDADELDAFVFGELMKHARTDELRVIRMYPSKAIETELAECKRRLRQFDDRIQRLFEALSMGAIDAGDFKTQRDKLERLKTSEQHQIDDLQRVIGGAPHEQTVPPAWQAYMRNLRLTDILTESQQRAVVLEFVHQVKVFRADWRDEAEVEIVFRWPESAI